MLRNLGCLALVLATGLGASQALAQRTDCGTLSSSCGSAGTLGGVEARPGGAEGAAPDAPSKKTRGIRPPAPSSTAVPAVGASPPPPPAAAPAVQKDGTTVKK